MMLRQSQALQDVLDFNEMDMLFDLDLEEHRLRIAARRVTANRKLEDVEANVNYWRAQAGWSDIEAEDGDDSTPSSSSSSIMPTALIICGALVGIVVLVMLVQAITRGSARRKVANGDSFTNRSNRGRSQHRSKSKTRSRSSKRTRESGGVSSAAGEGGNYNLMEEKKSKASSSRPRSKSRGRSRSKSRPRQDSRRQEC